MLQNNSTNAKQPQWARNRQKSYRYTSKILVQVLLTNCNAMCRHVKETNMHAVPPLRRGDGGERDWHGGILILGSLHTLMAIKSSCNITMF